MTRIVLGALPPSTLPGSASTNILGRRPCPPHHRGGDLVHPARQVGGGKSPGRPFLLTHLEGTR
jgi:hypothetical protein